MEVKDINIYPNITKTIKIVKMQISVMDMELFKSVSLRVVMFDENDIAVDVKVMTLDQSNGYNQWNNDDNFVIEWVKKQLAIGKYG